MSVCRGGLGVLLVVVVVGDDIGDNRFTYTPTPPPPFVPSLSNFAGSREQDSERVGRRGYGKSDHEHDRVRGRCCFIRMLPALPGDHDRGRSAWARGNALPQLQYSRGVGVRDVGEGRCNDRRY